MDFAVSLLILLLLINIFLLTIFRNRKIASNFLYIFHTLLTSELYLC